MAVRTGGPALERVMGSLADLCNLLLAAGGLGLAVWFVVFMCTPRKRKQV